MIFKTTPETFRVRLNNIKNEEFFDVRVPFSNQEQIISIDCSKEPLFAVFIHRKKNVKSSMGSS